MKWVDRCIINAGNCAVKWLFALWEVIQMVFQVLDIALMEKIEIGQLRVQVSCI